MSKRDTHENRENIGRRFDQSQYDFLKQCSDKGEEGIKEWNEWRKKNPDSDIRLEGASLIGLDLSHALLSTGGIVECAGDPAKQWLFRREVYLRGAMLLQAKLQGTDLRGTHLNGALLNHACLEGACLELTHLEGAQLKHAVFDKWTSFEGCEVDRYTDFRHADLGSLRVSPWVKQLMEYNVRRMNWHAWYKQHSTLKWPVQLFWVFSDYGLSTGRIVATFLTSGFIFGVIYWLWPNCVAVNGQIGDVRGLVHALYFSTMAMVGVGDVGANPDSWLGQTLLIIQVVFGYVLLAALVTRFAVLFTAGGPAGRFAEDKAMTGDRQEQKVKNGEG